MDPSLSHLISWAEPTRGDAPLPLTGPSLTLSPLGSPHAPTVFLFGGKFVQNRRLSAEMWAFDLGSRVWERVDAGEGPAPRYFHTMDVWEDKLVCFGGMSESEPHMSVHDDIWFFDCVRRQWLPQYQPSPEYGPQDPSLLPSARYAHLSSVSRGKLVVSGGQHADNSWVYEINVYDLRRKMWISRTDQPERQGLHSKGAYRSVACSAKHRVIAPRGDAKSTHTYTIDEEGEGGEIMCYSNYDFAKVRRELDLFTPQDMNSSPPVPSAKHVSPPQFNIRDISARMQGTTQPPGLRFPTGGIVGNHFILCGLYLASSSAAFSVYALNLDTFVWRHLEPGILASGSWNRAVIWADRAKLLVFGNQESDLAGDYGRRAVSVDHMAVVSLETFGIYTPPRLEVPQKMQDAGLSMLDENLASDFEVVCDDGRRIKCSRKLLADRWSWFAQQERELKQRINGVVSDAPVDINDTLLGACNPAKLNPTHLDLPEPFPVCVAFVQYFYTLSLSTPLQNRAPVLSALLFLAKQYKINRLVELVVHALHERLDGSNAVGVYEIATLSGQQNLQVRALNVIHSSKNGQSLRNHRQAPPSNSAGEHTSSDSPQAPPSSYGLGPGGSDVAPSPSTHTNGSFTNHAVTPQARSESPTLGLDDDEDASAMLAALDIKRTPSRPHRAAPAPPLPAMARAPLPTPPSSHHSEGVPEMGHYSTSHRTLSRRGSITSSEATSLATPPASLSGTSIRESTLLPRGSYSTLDSRGSASSQSRGLHTLSENGDGPQGGLGLGKTNSTSRKEYQLHHIDSTAPPPSAYSSHQAQIISALSTYQMEGRMPIPDRNATQTLRHPQGQVEQSSIQNQSQSRLPYLGNDSSKHLSMNTDSSRSSYSSHGHTGGGHQKMGSIMSSDTASFVTDYNIHLSSSSNLSRTETGGSGSTGTSSKQQLKDEKKAIAAAEKAARQAAQKERFEALRLQQAKAMALAQAESQRKAEIAAAQPPKEKQAPKSRFGKLGAKFTENVLFPASTGSNSMF